MYLTNHLINQEKRFWHADSDWISFGLTTNLFGIFRSIPSVHRKRCSENMQQIFRRTPMPKCDFSKVAKQLYWNHTLAWVFPCKFAAYFRNNFLRTLLESCLCIFYIRLVSTAVVLVKNVFLLVPTEKVLELDFPNAFNKSLIKCGKTDSCVMQYSTKICETTRNLGSHPVQLLNPIISKLCYSSYLVITPHSFNYCYPCYCFLTPQFQNFTNLPHWIFFVIIILLIFFVNR